MLPLNAKTTKALYGVCWRAGLATQSSSSRQLSLPTITLQLTHGPTAEGVGAAVLGGVASTSLELTLPEAEELLQSLLDANTSLERI